MLYFFFFQPGQIIDIRAMINEATKLNVEEGAQDSTNHNVSSFIFFSVLCLLCLCARLFICALWSPAGKGLTSWLSFMVSNCEFVTFPLVSWVRCGT